jgi:hypothetical protein
MLLSVYILDVQEVEQRKDAMTTYRAAYYLPAGCNGVGIVLTGPEHSGLSDVALIDEAMAEAERGNIIVDDEMDPMPVDEFRADIVIGDWKER